MDIKKELNFLTKIMNKPPLNEINTEIKRFSELRLQSIDIPLGIDRTELNHHFKDIHEYLLLIERNLYFDDVNSLIDTVRKRIAEIELLLIKLTCSDTQKVPTYFESN